MKVNAVVDVKKFSSHVQAKVMEKFEMYSSGAYRLSMQGTLEEVNKFYEDLRQTITQIEQGKNNPSLSAIPSEASASEGKESQDVTCRVPLSQYQAACQTYQKEMEMIKRENRVRIQSEVTLSFLNNGTGRDMRSKACQDITKLIQNCVGTPCSQANLPSKKKSEVGAKHPLPQKILPNSSSRGLDCPLKNSKAGQIVMEVGRRPEQTEGDVKSQENLLPFVQPVGPDISTRVSVSGKIKEITRTEGQDEVTTTDGVSQNAAEERKGATPSACRQGFGNAEGLQPKGTMSIRTERESLPGFLGYST